jgi:hypothetical protein
MLRLAARRTASQVQRYAAVSAGQARGFAAPAPAAKADLDWDALDTSIASEGGKRELAQLRTTYLDVQQKLDEMTKEPEPINWAQWKKEVDPQLVDAFQKAYDSMPLPEYQDSGLEAVQKTFDDLLVQAGELSAHSEKRMGEIQQEIKAIDAELDRVAKLTIDDVLEAEPELGRRIHAEISEGKFIP